MTNTRRILILDHDAIASAALAETLARHGYATETVSSAEEAIDAIDRAAANRDLPFGVLITDTDRTDPHHGFEVIQRLRGHRAELVPIVISGFRKVESAVRAMRCGVADYLLKPLVEAELLDAVTRAMQTHLLFTDERTGPDTLADACENVPESTPPQPVPPADATDQTKAGEWTPMPLAEAMKEPERRILLAALEANGWNRQRTAEQLDINRTTLYKKIRQYRLDEPAA